MPSVSGALRATLLALGLGAFLWYAPLIWWAAPHATAPGRTKTFATDEILPLEALAEMRSTFVAAAPDRNFGYPWWHYFVTAAAQAPYIAALRMSGDWSPAGPTYPFGFEDPVGALEVLTIIGRAVSVLMGAGIILATFAFARTLWGQTAGVIAASLTLVSYPMTHYSRTGNLDVPAFFWSAIALAILARIFTSGRSGDRLEFFGVAETLPPLPATIQSRRIMGREKWVGQPAHGSAVLDYLRRDGPAYWVVVPDWTSRPGMEHSADCPPEVHAALVDGSAGYQLAAYSPPRLLWPGPFGRPRLDNPSVAPPVRIFRRAAGGDPAPGSPNPAAAGSGGGAH